MKPVTFEWITDRLPEVGEDVLFVADGAVHFGRLRESGRWVSFTQFSWIYESEEVKAWMPIPKIEEVEV